jgi:hypothetical protein
MKTADTSRYQGVCTSEGLLCVIYTHIISTTTNYCIMHSEFSLPIPSYFQ